MYKLRAKNKRSSRGKERERERARSGSISGTTSDPSAATRVRISLAAGSAVVIRSTASGTRNAIGPQSAIANVALACQNSPIDLRIHHHLLIFKALANQTVAVPSSRFRIPHHPVLGFWATHNPKDPH
eukprot:Gb_31247 [translate_table: standard]